MVAAVLAVLDVTTATREGPAVECESCGANGPIEKTKRRAIAEWNAVAKVVRPALASRDG